MKLPVHGGTGARAARSQYSHPFTQPKSRAQIAKPMYTDPASAGGPARAGDLYGNPANPQQPAGGGPSGSGAGSGDQGGAAAAPPPPEQFDLSSDPLLQQVQASVTRSNANALSGATSQREQALEQYGDPALAASVLGAGDPFAQAAGANPESTLALLKRGYDTGLWNFDNTLDPSLVYSGARIKGESQIGQTYQDQRARAAEGIQHQLGAIQDAYDSALASNNQSLASAIADAYDRAVQNALTNPPGGGTASGQFDEGAPPAVIHKPTKSALAHAATRRSRPIRAPH